MANETVTLDVVDADVNGTFEWVVRAEKPVRRLFRSCGAFETRVEAVRDFESTCEILGWQP